MPSLNLAENQTDKVMVSKNMFSRPSLAQGLWAGIEAKLDIESSKNILNNYILKKEDIKKIIDIT